MSQLSRKKYEMMERCNQVSEELVGGKTEEEIAQKIGVSASTVDRAVAHIKKDSEAWIDGLGKGLFIFLYKSALDRISKRTKYLDDQAAKTSDPIEKSDLLEKANRSDDLYLKWLSGEVTVRILRKALSEIGVQRT